MSRLAGGNMAVTKDGGTYNKLRRPDDFVASLTSKTKPTAEATPAITPTTDATKRKRDEADGVAVAPGIEPASKRQREEYVPQTVPLSRKAVTGNNRRVPRPIKENGMQTMFPGLDDEESSDEATQEALAYLRSVRTEASSIPTLLVATPEVDEDQPDRSMYNDGRGDRRALYNDGTWVAVDPNPAHYSDSYWSEDSVYDLDPQEVYYNSLLRRYNSLRNTLASADRKELDAIMKAEPSKYTNMRLPKDRSEWNFTLENEYPTPARVSQLDENNLYWGIEHCTESLNRYKSISKQRSCWIWTLLALAGEMGTLDYWRAGRIRDLGSKAGRFGLQLRSGTVCRSPSDDEDEEIEDWDMEGDGTGGEEDEQDSGEISLGSEENKSDDPALRSYGQCETEEIGVNGHGERTAADALPDTECAYDFSNKQDVHSYDGANDEAPGDSTKGDGSDASGDMSISEDEGEVKEDDEETVEEARARLLVQLGDRLLQTSMPPIQSKPQGPGRRSQSKGKEGDASSSETPPKRAVPSRAEAEMLRQQMRKQELKKAKEKEALELAAAKAALEAKLNASTSPSVPLQALTQKTYASRAEAEGHRQGFQERDSPQDGDQQEEKEEEVIDEKNDSEPEDVNPVDLNTRVTIDMILTVVAECYGQKDLLRFREAW